MPGKLKNGKICAVGYAADIKKLVMCSDETAIEVEEMMRGYTENGCLDHLSLTGFNALAKSCYKDIDN